MENAPQSEDVRLVRKKSHDNGAINVASLTRGMVRGEEAAYRSFHGLYFDRLFRYLLVVAAGNEDAAREALQIAFTRVVRHIKIFTDENVFWSWLTVVARTALFDQTRKRRRYFAFLDRFSRELPAEDIHATNAEDNKLEALLASSIARLSADDQNLLARKYTDGRSVRAIADELQTTDKAVESRLSRVRSKLKEILFSELKRHEES